MEGEIDNPDFEPTSEEGRANINEEIDDDDEYKSLLKRPDEDESNWAQRMRNKFGSGADYAIGRLKKIFKTKNPNKPVPEYMLMTDMKKGDAIDDLLGPPDLKQQLQREIIENIKERFPKLDLARIDVQAGDKGQIQVKLSGKSKWYDLYQRKNSNIINKKLSKEITEALGEENLTVQMEKADDSVDSNTRYLTEAANYLQRLEAERDELVEE